MSTANLPLIFVETYRPFVHLESRGKNVVFPITAEGRGLCHMSNPELNLYER